MYNVGFFLKNITQIFIAFILILVLIIVVICQKMTYKNETYAPYHIQGEKNESDQEMMNKAYQAYAMEGEESNSAANAESNEIYSVNSIPVEPKLKDYGYNLIPSNLLRQAMGISGDGRW